MVIVRQAALVGQVGEALDSVWLLLEAPEILLQHLHHKVTPVVPVSVPPRRLNTLAAAVGRVLSVGMQT